MKHNHLSIWFFISALAVCGLNACDDSNDTTTDTPECSPACTDEQECINGECKPKKGDADKCDPACTDEQECINGECKSKKSDTDNCDPACTDEQECINGECKSKQNQDTKVCDPACNDDEECIEGECKPKTDNDPCHAQCDENEICSNGECIPQQPQELVCAPACNEDEECIEGVCAPKTKPGTGTNDEEIEDDDLPPDDGTGDDDTTTTETEVSVLVTPVDGLVTVQGKQNASFTVVLNQPPAKDVAIPIKSTNDKTGTLSTSKLSFTSDNWNSPQSVTITATQTSLADAITEYSIIVGPTQSEDAKFNNIKETVVKVSHQNSADTGSVIPQKLTLDKTSANLLLKGEPVTIKASFDKDNVSDKYVWWEIQNTTDSVDVSSLVDVAMDMKTRSITIKSNVVPNSKICLKKKLDLARTLKVTAKHSSGLEASATVELKPYLRTGLSLGKLKKIRDFNTPGHANTDIKKGEYELGEMQCGYYDAHTTQVMNHDMISEYVQPVMYKTQSSYYGTRASVLAAARFLVTQFPKDVPYASPRMYNNETPPPTIGRYTWTSYDYNEDRYKVRIFGLSLTDKAYNSFASFKDSNIILGGPNQDIITPWACEVKTSKGKPVTKNGNAVKYPYNGLRCSGFVSWALLNGRFYLGDWNTVLFAKSSSCTNSKGNNIRNFHCKDIVNDTKLNTKGKLYHWSNANGQHFSAFAKFNQLKEEDFLPIEKLKGSSIKDTNFKAGDLLWNHHYTCPLVKGKCPDDETNCSVGGGHVAMVLGISRNDDKSVKYVYVAEAKGRAGNHLTAYTLNGLKNHWKKNPKVKDGQCEYKDTRLIKMDRVYNYAHTKNPTTVKEDLNTYKYTELWF